MRLRTQMLAVGLATLVVPVLGWQSVRQLHVSLQQTRIDAQTLAVANLRVALADAGELDLPLALGAAPLSRADWYAEGARWPLFVDGYADDWRQLVAPPSRWSSSEGGTSLTLRVARRAARLYLFARVRDARVVHHVPPRLDADAGENEGPDPDTLLANGDALEVFVETTAGARTHAVFSVIAPGPVRVVHASDGAPDALRFLPDGRQVPRWRAEWVDNATGYQIEIEMPLPPAGSRVGIAVIDVDRAGAARERWAGTMSPRSMREAIAATLQIDGGSRAPEGGRLRFESAEARTRLRPWVTPGTRARLYDAAGRLLADVNALYAPLPEDDAPPTGFASGLLDAVLFRVFAWMAAGDMPLFPETEKTRQPLHLDATRRAAASAESPTRRYVTVDNDRVLGTLVSIGEAGAGEPAGYLLFESNEEHASAFTGSRLARLFAALLLASLAVAALLFAWATRLSVRIRRLSRDTERAVDESGRVRATAGSGADDEIGDLSRNLSSLLARSAAYTRYLETLSGRLSHELGTPLSVVRTSIENLDRGRLDAESRTLVERASGGAERLGDLIRALLESTRFEQSVQRAPLAPLDLAAWLDEARAQYAQIHPKHAFRITASFAALACLVEGGGERAPRELSEVRPRASAALLQQALDKLVDNAVDFATRPGIALLLTRETVAGGVDKERITLAVANAGPPIGERHRARLFDPAFSSRRGSPDDAPASAGVHAGLGLHVVRLIAEVHGGETFVLELPPSKSAPDGERVVVVGLRLPLAPGAGAAPRGRD